MGYLDWTKSADAPPPKDKPLWLYHPSSAGGAIPAYWNTRNGWWSSIRGAGSKLFFEQPSHWMIRTEPPGPPEGYDPP